MGEPREGLQGPLVLGAGDSFALLAAANPSFIFLFLWQCPLRAAIGLQNTLRFSQALGVKIRKSLGHKMADLSSSVQ